VAKVCQVIFLVLSAQAAGLRIGNAATVVFYSRRQLVRTPARVARRNASSRT
jgi:hypothetical protein